MKRLVFILMCLCSVFAVEAQNKVAWSVKFGLGASTWMGSDTDGSSALFNQKIGVGIDVPLTGLVSFQTGLMWESKGAEYDYYINNGNITKYEVECNQNYFQMPLLAAFHVGVSPKFDMVFTAGGYIACGAKGKSEVDINDDVTTSWKTFSDANVPIDGTSYPFEGLHRFDAGLQAGASLDFKKWMVGLDGEFGLCKVIPKTKARNLAFYFTVGYKF